MTSNLSTEHDSLGEALLAVQAEAKAIQATADNEGFKKGGKPSKYVPLETLMPMVLPLLNKHGLTWTTRPTMVDGSPALLYQLWCPGSAGVIEDTMPLLGVSNMQQLGAAITYARRQSLMAVLGLVAEKDDDSGGVRGRQPASDKKLTQAEIAKIQTALAEADIANGDLFLTAAGVSTLSTDWTKGDAFKLKAALDLRKAAE